MVRARQTGVILATSAATCLRARTICIITSSSSAVSCRGSTVPTARTEPNTRRMWDPTCAGYIPISECTSSICASSRTVNRDASFANLVLFFNRGKIIPEEGSCESCGRNDGDNDQPNDKRHSLISLCTVYVLIIYIIHINIYSIIHGHTNSSLLFAFVNIHLIVQRLSVFDDVIDHRCM